MSIEADTVLQLEQRRCMAINGQDGSSLRGTLWDDYVHIHAGGNIDDRAGFIAGIIAHPRIVERGPITVRLYGDAALLIGEQVNRRGGNAMTGIMQQVALKRDGSRRFVSAQMTRKVERRVSRYSLAWKTWRCVPRPSTPSSTTSPGLR